MKLMPTISDAQDGNLLGSAGSPQFAFVTDSVRFGIAGVVLSGVPGCALRFAGNIIPANPLATVATGTSQSGVGGGVFRVGGDLPGPVLIYKAEPGSIGPLPKPRSPQ